MLNPWTLTSAFVLGHLVAVTGHADWPMLRGDARHTGFVAAQLEPPFRVAWVREIEGERLGTAMEPILAKDRLYLATHSGSLYALDAASGKAIWRFQAHGPFLHSPAVAGDRVMAACADGQLDGLLARDGALAWRVHGGPGGFSAAPTVADGFVYIGTRAGDVLAVDAAKGITRWRVSTGAPVRQTAAVADGRVFVTPEDLRVRCYRAADGALEWTSEPLPGQTARDYYPVIVRTAGRTYVIVRTNPLRNMAQRIGRDRTLLCRNAGVDDSGWQKVDAWVKSDAARGSPELWAKEQAAIVRHLETDRDARSFFVLDAETGQEACTAPVLWVAGCQAVGAQPALTSDGRLLVFYRSAYGNWNHGVAPLVALGLLDLANNHITPLFHQQGSQPRWNCFWGTADESQNFLVVADCVLIVHQGTLSGFNLKRNELFPIAGNRDTYGGFPNPPWARNEWHGPARAGVAVVGRRIYWQTGSRILCLESGASAGSQSGPAPAAVSKAVPTGRAPERTMPGAGKLRAQLGAAVEVVLAQDWAPLFIEPGLAGREFAFDDSGDLFEALAWAYPHLAPTLKAVTLRRLRAEWIEHPPFTREAWYPLERGSRREWFRVPLEYCTRTGNAKLPHPFGNLGAIRLYADRCGEMEFVQESWPKLKAAYDDFAASGWRLDPAKGDLFANRYLASLLAFSRLAEASGDAGAAQEAKDRADETSQALVEWWRRAAAGDTLRTFNTVSQLDPFIGKGDGISLALAPHRHKLGLFHDLTPEVAGRVLEDVAPAVDAVWQTFVALCPTWALTGEERQIHFGENFVDPPEFATGGFRALAWLRSASGEELAGQVDLPFCRADLDYIIKLALALEAGGDRWRIPKFE